MLKSKLKPHIGVKSLILIIVCGILIAADLLTKHYEELCNWNLIIISGFIEIEGGLHHRNPGCAFSFLNENPQIGQPILITFTIIMLAFLIFIFIVVPERFTVIKVSISIIIAGAIGNLVDRFMLGAVRDFIGLNMLFNRFNLVYCNLADFFIVIGAAMIVIDMLFFSEFAVFPLTKKAKEAQAKRREEENERERLKNEQSDCAYVAESDDGSPEPGKHGNEGAENTESPSDNSEVSENRHKDEAE